MEHFKQTKIRTILHADVNNFFASVECATKPELASRPVAVTGNPEKRNGIILAKNEIAKKFGVKTGQVIGEAKAICPDLICLPPHYDLYEEISVALHEIYLDYTNFVEPLGLDECWLDVTDSLKILNKTGAQIADELREKVKKKFNLTISVGVSFSKIFAKLGSDLRKPDFTTEIPFDSFKNITYLLPLNSIIGIGKRLEAKFASIDILTIGDFVKLDDDYLISIMGINGINLKKDLLGERITPVLDYYHLPPPKSIGNGTTTIKDIYRREDVKKVIYFLSQKISKRLIRHKLVGSEIHIKLKSANLKVIGKSSKILPTNSVKEISKNALELCDKIYKYNFPLRAIRIKISSLSSSSFKQLSMFDENSKDYSEIIDEINKKYGKIFLASDLASFINLKSNPHE
jgi:DNA polymerase-4